jgi:hypothetical protein
MEDVEEMEAGACVLYPEEFTYAGAGGLPAPAAAWRWRPSAPCRE